MGIPSYFRKIIQKFPGIVTDRLPGSVTASLCFDFNCLVYRCIRAPGMPPPAATEEWEDLLLKEVGRTVKEVWTASGRPRRVFIAVDGVVPMAKIRQQRVRRFKSAWLRRGGPGGWDSNAITPGTAFMEKLSASLAVICTKNGWTLSSADEEGEGEHKIMQWLRAQGKGGAVVIYGLDADLILLSMLTGESLGVPIWLLRERQEFGGKLLVDADGDQEYSFMNIEELKARIGVKEMSNITNYVGLMSLMGNDFLPHSITHKLNDDGHDCVLSELRLMKKSGRWLVVDGRLQLGVLGEICKRWSVDADERIMTMIRKKWEQAERGVAKGMDPSEGLPLEWKVERSMLVGAGAGAGAGAPQRLAPDWRETYWDWIHPCANRDEICGAYIYGFQWILDYYLGKPVNKSWMFPAWIPPLWSDLADSIATAVAPQPEEVAPIQPAEQLAMVLPLESWGLVRDPKLRRLPLLAPQMWPSAFSFFSLGRKWLWECEARVPVLTPVRLRELLA